MVSVNVGMENDVFSLLMLLLCWGQKMFGDELNLLFLREEQGGGGGGYCVRGGGVSHGGVGVREVVCVSVREVMWV